MAKSSTKKKQGTGKGGKAGGKKQGGRKQEKSPQRPAQSQPRQPGRQAPMRPQPDVGDPRRPAGPRLTGKVALITGGDSGIGQAVALAFAREGAQVAVVYLEEDEDARTTQRLVEEAGGRCELIRGDLGERDFCHEAVEQVVGAFGRLDVLINNAAEQHPAENLEEIDEDQLVRTFRTNLFAMFFLTQAALPHLRRQKGSSIINTTSVTAYRGSAHLIDYAATKGAIVAFTRSLALNLAEAGIRVNAVAPGPIWTPLIPATFDAEKVASFGSDAPMGRAGEPVEVAGCYVFLASEEASYMSGQVLHPNGGEVVGG